MEMSGERLLICEQIAPADAIRGGMNVQIGKTSIGQFDITPASTEGRLQKVAAIKYESARWKAGRHVCDNYQRVTEFCTKTIFRGSRRGTTSLQW